MTPDAVTRLEHATRALLAAIDRGECHAEPIDIQALIYLLEQAGLLKLAVSCQRAYSLAVMRGLVQGSGVRQ